MSTVTNTVRHGVDTEKLTIRVAANTSLPAERVLDAGRDFSERRADVWSNVKVKHLEVHERGETFADITEGTWVVGLFWERSRYDWSQPGLVKATVIDSSVFEPGSTWELRATPCDGGSEVEIVLHRGFDPSAIWRTIERERCTVVLGVPTTWKLLMDAPEFATADRTTRPIGSALPFGRCSSSAIASSADLPLMSSVTRRALRGEKRWNLALARTSITRPSTEPRRRPVRHRSA